MKGIEELEETPTPKKTKKPPVAVAKKKDNPSTYEGKWLLTRIGLLEKEKVKWQKKIDELDEQILNIQKAVDVIK